MAQRSEYLERIRAAAETGWRENPGIVARWKATTKPSVLWGYDAPGHPVYLAAALAFLYQQTHETTFATRAGELLSTFGDLRSTLPPDAMFGSRVLIEALPNTFGLQLDGAPDRVGYAKWRRWEGEIPLP